MDEQLYRIWFDDPSGQRRSVDQPDGLWPALKGFWVDEEWQYERTTGRCLHWVPPGQIVLVTKLPRDTDSAGASGG